MSRILNIKIFLFIGLCLGITSYSSGASKQEELTSTQIKTLKSGIYEVVTKKLPDTTQYKDDFPHELIPFHIRNDKYHSVGTAFFVGDNTFVSAAHVFNVGYFSLFSDGFALRDTKGNIFEIDQVLKLSNYRDLIKFNVKGKLQPSHKFEFAPEYSEGDVVYSAGNALGEGVIFRKGILTSFTFEPVNGQWKDIRFSAAASPGNSGGPLLNLSGEVVGIVTKKSGNENLNYAFPIKEFSEFTNEYAEFFNNQMGESESSKSLRYKWEFKTDLPKPILKLREEAEKSFYARFNKGREEFVEKYEKDIFPNHPNVIKYLKNQSNNDVLSAIDINGNGEWSLYYVEEKQKVKIANEQYLWFYNNDKIIGNYQFILDRPAATSLKDFISQPKLVLDTFLNSVQWKRTVADTPVYIESYGEPSHSEDYTDVYGRKWNMNIWYDSYADRGIMMYCLPIPQGVACDLIESNSGWLYALSTEYGNNLHRIMLSYSAKISEWQEFLDLPDKYRPEFLTDSKVNLQDSLIYKFGQFAGEINNKDFNQDSNLYVTVEISPNDLNKLVVTNLGFKPKLSEKGIFYLSKYYDLGEDASDSYKSFWTKITKQQAPYNFEVVPEGKVNSKFANLNAIKKGSKSIGKDVGKGAEYIVGCKLQSELSVDDLEQKCASFIDGIK